MRSKLYVIHNTTDKVTRGEVSLHLNAFACPSPIKERKWGWIWRVSLGRVPPSKATLRNLIADMYFTIVSLTRFLLLFKENSWDIIGYTIAFFKLTELLHITTIMVQCFNDIFHYCVGDDITVDDFPSFSVSHILYSMMSSLLLIFERIFMFNFPFLLFSGNIF